MDIMPQNSAYLSIAGIEITQPPSNPGPENKSERRKQGQIDGLRYLIEIITGKHITTKSI